MFFLGIDYSKRFSVLTVINSEGEVVLEGKLDNRRKEFERFLPKGERIRAVVEAGRNWNVAVELVEGLVDEIKLAHPLKVRVIAESKIKTDRIDSCILARLLRADMIPEAYLRDRQMREKQMILRLRSFWIRQRTAVRNRIHALIDGQSEEIREDARRYGDLFGRSGKAWLTGLTVDRVSQEAIQSLLGANEHLSNEIRSSDEQVKQLYTADEDCARIDSIPGFGVFLSVLAKVEIGDIARFRSASHLASYAGVIPSTYSSGGRTRHGRIVKQGNRFLRWGLVEAAIHAGKESSELKKAYGRLKRKKGTKMARVAIARKLCGILFRVLSQKDHYRIHKVEQKRSRLPFVSSVPT